MGQALGGGDELRNAENAFVFDFLFAFGRLVVATGWFSV
jgi:hypothetical protein